MKMIAFRLPTVALLIAAVVAVVCMSDADGNGCGGVMAFAPTMGSVRSAMALSAEQQPTNRRDVLLGFAAAVTAAGSMAASPQPAAASYSAYANREKDWQERVERGDVKVSSARELRQQLREIAPMNDDSRSKIFCPNGPSAAVSPLMENKCGDRLATPSVFGRQDDVLGNSIPGFKSGYDYNGMSALSTGVAFPQYKENEFKLRER